jgi:thiol-disulfide isomerase/thioredoxin
LLHLAETNRLMKLFFTLLTAGILPVLSLAQTPGAAAADTTDLSQYQTADALWMHIQDVKKGPSVRPATPEQYKAVITGVVTQLAAGAAEFVKRYPDDPRKWDARLIAIEMAGAINNIEGHPNRWALTAQLQALAGEPEAPAAIRGQARHELFELSLRDYASGDRSVSAASIVAQLNQFIAEFPTYPSLDVLKYRVARTLERNDPASGMALLKELADSGEGKVADQARKDLNAGQQVKTPLDLHFTAVDGSTVDLSRMRGKVVLVDFWATWCAPCRAEVPNVVAAYSKLHDKGFEIVGISLDKDRDRLLAFTAENGMTWPQYFDGQGWQNSISSGFGIQSVPTMWLVNKQGYVVSTNGRADLEGQVEKLLAE